MAGRHHNHLMTSILGTLAYGGVHGRLRQHRARRRIPVKLVLYDDEGVRIAVKGTVLM